MRNRLSVSATLFMLVVLAGIGAARAQTPAPPAVDATVVPPTASFVYGVIIASFVIALIVLGLIRAAIERSQFSLGDALSEEAQVTGGSEEARMITMVGGSVGGGFFDIAVEDDRSIQDDFDLCSPGNYLLFVPFAGG